MSLRTLASFSTSWSQWGWWLCPNDSCHEVPLPPHRPKVIGPWTKKKTSLTTNQNKSCCYEAEFPRYFITEEQADHPGCSHRVSQNPRGSESETLLMSDTRGRDIQLTSQSYCRKCITVRKGWRKAVPSTGGWRSQCDLSATQRNWNS